MGDLNDDLDDLPHLLNLDEQPDNPPPMQTGKETIDNVKTGKGILIGYEMQYEDQETTISIQEPQVNQIYFIF